MPTTPKTIASPTLADSRYPDNEEWLHEQTWTLPTSLDELRKAIAPYSLSFLLTLPIAAAMPPALRRAVRAAMRDEQG